MFVYTSHAQTRIGQRNLSTDRIEQTVLRPDTVWSGFRKCMVARKEFSGAVLEVVYRQQEDAIIIVTAYELEE